jgi:hypothetical protein
MIDGMRNTGWLGRNRSLMLIAFGFFIANQVVEALSIFVFEFNYAGLCTWDCKLYAGVEQNGYDFSALTPDNHDMANWAFFPVFPMVARLVKALLGTNPEIALVITSKVFFLLSIFAFLKFASAYRPGLDPMVVASAAALSPFSFYGNVGYTESLFLLLTCVFFYFLKRGNLIAAGVAGAFLTASRAVGIFTVASYLYALWREGKLAGKGYDKVLLGFLLIPLGLAIFMTFLYFRSGDAMAFSHIQRVWLRIPGNPFAHLMEGWHGNDRDKYSAIASMLALLAPLYFFYKKELDLALFSLGCTLLPLSTAVWAMPRYISWQAPILLVIALLLTKRLVWVTYIAGSVSVMTFFYFSWFSGKGFLV